MDRTRLKYLIRLLCQPKEAKIIIHRFTKTYEILRLIAAKLTKLKALLILLDLFCILDKYELNFLFWHRPKKETKKV